MNAPRTEMKCRICGGFSSAQTCHACDSSPVYAAYSLAVIQRDEAREYAVALQEPARELLFLYDWRPKLAKLETHPAADPKEVKRLLREYGERKKAGWIALRAALAKNPAVHAPGGTDGLAPPIARVRESAAVGDGGTTKRGNEIGVMQPVCARRATCTPSDCTYPTCRYSEHLAVDKPPSISVPKVTALGKRLIVTMPNGNSACFDPCGEIGAQVIQEIHQGALSQGNIHD